MTESATNTFGIKAILSVTTGRLLSTQDEFNALLEWMVPGADFGTQVTVARKAILEQHDVLASVNGKSVNRWLTQLIDVEGADVGIQTWIKGLNLPLVVQVVRPMTSTTCATAETTAASAVHGTTMRAERIGEWPEFPESVR